MTQPDRAKTLQQMRRLSDLLDNAIAIPGTSYRIGLDPILGLLPGGGDAAAAFLSAYIILQSARLGLSRQRLGQMFFNVLVELVVGTLPIAGDLFDVAWKANAKNVALLEAELNVDPATVKAAGTEDIAGTQRWALLLVAGLVVAALMLVGVSMAVGVLIVQQFAS